MLDNLETTLREAQQRGDAAEVGRVLRRAKSLPDRPVFPELRVKLNETLARWQTLVSKNKVVAWSHSGPDGTATLLLEGPKLATRVAPDQALIVPRQIDGRSALGTVRFDPTVQGRVEVTLGARLAFDPRRAAMLNAELTRMGEGPATLFTNWEPRPRLVGLTGLLDAKALLSGEGTLTLTLGIDAEAGGAVLHQLATDGGLTLLFDWTYHDPPTLVKVNDHSFPLTFSLGARDKHAVRVEGERLVNGGPHRVTVAYLRDATGGHFAAPRMGTHASIDAGASVPLADFDLPTDVVLARLDAPAEAVRASGSSEMIDELSANLVLYDELTVTNRLPPVDSRRQTQLRNVEVRVMHVAADGSSSLVATAELAAAGSGHDSITVRILNPSRRRRQYRLEGTVKYAPSGQDELRPQTLNDLSADVTQEMLP